MALLKSKGNQKVDLSAPPMTELGVTGSNMWSALGGSLYNPDNVGIGIYKKMLEDAEVQAAYNLIKLATLSRDWRIIGTTEMAEQIEFLKHNFDGLDGKLDGALAGIMEAIVYGFSVTEIVWQYLETGKFKGKIGLKKLKTLDPEGIEFKVDDLGNMTDIIQKTDQPGKKDIVIPPEKCIVYSENKQHGNYYGTSRLKSVYKNWFIKDTLTKFWNIYLERFGMPLAIGTVPNQTFMDKMQKVLENLQSKSSIVKTAGWEIDFLEAKKSGAGVSEYKLAIDYHDAQILKGMLVPSLMLSVEKSGSYALGKTHFDIFTLMLRYLENDLDGMVETYLIRPLINYNYGEQENYPEFKFEPLTKDDLLNLSKVFALLVKNGIVGTDETFMRDMMNIPHRSETVIEETPGNQVPPGTKEAPPPASATPQQSGPFGKPKPKGGGSQQVKTPTDRDPSAS